MAFACPEHSCSSGRGGEARGAGFATRIAVPWHCPLHVRGAGGALHVAAVPAVLRVAVRAPRWQLSPRAACQRAALLSRALRRSRSFIALFILQTLEMKISPSPSAAGTSPREPGELGRRGGGGSVGRGSGCGEGLCRSPWDGCGSAVHRSGRRLAAGTAARRPVGYLWGGWLRFGTASCSRCTSPWWIFLRSAWKGRTGLRWGRRCALQGIVWRWRGEMGLDEALRMADGGDSR